jgi:hypothetical protein
MGLDQEAPDSLHDRRVPAGIGLPTHFASQESASRFRVTRDYVCSWTPPNGQIDLQPRLMATCLSQSAPALDVSGDGEALGPNIGNARNTETTPGHSKGLTGSVATEQTRTNESPVGMTRSELAPPLSVQ